MHKADNSKVGEKDPQTANNSLEVDRLDVLPPPRVSKQVRKLKTLPKTERPLFENKPIERMATGAPVISATQAYLKPPDWSGDAKDSLCFPKVFGKGRYIEFYILNNQEHQPGFITHLAEKEILDRYGVMAARLHAVFATYAALQHEPWKEPFNLRGTELIKTLGLHRTNRMNKSQKLKGVADLAWIVGTLGTVIHWYEGNLDLRVTRKSPMWTILYVEEFYQPELIQGTAELSEVVIRVMPGAWAEKFLNKVGAQQRKALYQYGFINQDVFDLDHHKQELAAALALYLTQNRRSHSNGKYRIQTLLEAIMSIQEIDSIRRSRLKRSRFIKRFYSVLEALTEIGFNFQFSELFPKALRPAWATLPNENEGELDPVATAPKDERLPEGFFDTWLTCCVSITAPLSIEAAVKEFEQKNTETTKRISTRREIKSTQSRESNEGQSGQQQSLGASTQPERLTGAMVQQARFTIGMNQTELGRVMGRSQSWVRDIENKLKDQPVSPKYVEKLREVLRLK